MSKQELLEKYIELLKVMLKKEFIEIPESHLEFLYENIDNDNLIYDFIREFEDYTEQEEI